MSALVIVEHDGQAVAPATLNAVTAALACDPDVHLLVVGANVASVAQAASTIQGVSTVLVADGEGLANALAEDVTNQVLTVAKAYSHIVLAATSTGKSVAPRVAAKLDVAQISEAVKVVNANTFQRPIYAGNAIATVESADATKVLTVRTTAFPAANAQGGAARLEAISPVSSNGKSVFIRREITKNDRPELTVAKVVVSGGRGLGSAEEFLEVLSPLADKLNAAMGASRAAVDSGYAPNDWQVGQTGKVVAPDLYIAVGISGAIQHLAGMKDAKVIVAINKDPEAPIFGVADYGLQADLFEAVPALTAAL